MRNVADLLADGKTPYERRFGKPFKGPVLPFGSLVEYHPRTAKDQSRIHQFGKKKFTWIVPRIRGGNLEGWRTDRRPWGVGNDGRIGNLLEKTQCERGDISQSKMDESKPVEEIINWEHPPWYGSDQFKENVILTFLENQKSLFRHLTTHFRMLLRRWMTFGPCQETSFSAITLNPESNFTRREKNHSLFHLNTLTYPELLIRIWMSSKSDASTSIGISMGQETCLILAHVSLSLLCWKNTSRWIYVVQDEIDEKAADIQARLFMARILGEKGKECQAEGEAKVVTWTTSTRQCQKITRNFFHWLEDKEFKEAIKNARKKLETSMAPAMPCKISKNNQNCGNGDKSIKKKSNLACILEASESTCLRLGESLPNHREDHITGKEDNSLQHYSLVHKFIPMPQAIKIPAAKSSSGQGMGCESEVRKEVIDEARMSGATVHFASLMDICHLKSAELETKAPKIQRSSCIPRWYCERRFWIFCSIHWRRVISITNDSSKSHGYHFEIARLRGTSSWRSICLCPDKNGRYFRITENSQIGMSRHLDSSTTTQMAKIMVSMEDPVVPLERNLYGHPLAGLFWERQHEEVPLKHGWERIPNWECLFVHREKGLFLSVYVDDIKFTRKKQNSDPMLEVLNKEVDWGEATSFLDHVYLRSCQEMCGAILWAIKQDDPTTLQSIYSMHWWPPFQRRRIEICWRIVTSMISNCSAILIFGTY